MNILIVKLGALGDVINTLPLAVNLKAHFNARIHWLVEPLSLPLLATHPAVDCPIVFRKKQWRTQAAGVLRQIRRRRFDVVLDLQRLLKSGLFTMAAIAGRRIGFDRERCKEMTWMLPLERIAPADAGRHMLLQYLEFARHLGIAAPGSDWELPIPAPFNAALPSRYCVLNIGATKPANRWTVEGFSGLARRLNVEKKITCVLTGGPEDRLLADRIMVQSDVDLINLVGRTSLMDLKAVLYHAGAVVSCDTGPMHLAVALGKPVVALFGPSDPRRTGPFRGQVIRKKWPCSPCNQRVCETAACMQALTVDDVYAPLVRYLEERGSGQGVER